MSLPKITDLNEEEFRAWAASIGEKPFRATQLFQWIHRHRVNSFDEMSNISKKFREKISANFILDRIPIIKITESGDGSRKFLQKLKDGHEVESVLMPHDDHYTVCISTQAGCAMACRFCLTATMGLKRHLTTGEIVEQVINAYTLVPEGESVRNIVFMGMGEPFHNYDNTIRALSILQNEKGMDFSNRRITISTCGLVPQILKFAKEDIKANLAISLNGVTQEGRKQLMPITKRYPLDELMAACREFTKGDKRKITFEYILMDQLTDSMEAAKKMVKLLHGIKGKVNLIPYNENPHLEFKASKMEQIKRFQQFLLDHGVLATLRISKGQDISAACGQLASQNQKKRGEEWKK